MNSIEDVIAFCESVTSGEPIDVDDVDLPAFQFPLTKEFKEKLPQEFLPLFDAFYHRDEMLTKRILLADVTVRMLSQAVVRLAEEIQELRDGGI